MTPTVLDRLLAHGLTRHVAERHIRYGRVRVDGMPTSNPDAPAPDGLPVLVVLPGRVIHA